MPKKSETVSRTEPQIQDFPIVSSDMAERAANSIAFPEPRIQKWFQEFKAKHEAALLNVVAKAYDFAVNEVAPSISADKKNLNRLNPISETPIAQVLPDLQPQELLFCGACGNVEKAPKRWKPLPGASRGSSRTEVMKRRPENFKCDKCAEPEDAVRRKMAQKRTEKPHVVVTQN